MGDSDHEVRVIVGRKAYVPNTLETDLGRASVMSVVGPALMEWLRGLKSRVRIRQVMSKKMTELVAEHGATLLTLDPEAIGPLVQAMGVPDEAATVLQVFEACLKVEEAGNRRDVSPLTVNFSQLSAVVGQRGMDPDMLRRGFDWMGRSSNASEPVKEVGTNRAIFSWPYVDRLNPMRSSSSVERVKALNEAKESRLGRTGPMAFFMVSLGEVWTALHTHVREAAEEFPDVRPGGETHVNKLARMRNLASTLATLVMTMLQASRTVEIASSMRAACVGLADDAGRPGLLYPALLARSLDMSLGQLLPDAGREPQLLTDVFDKRKPKGAKKPVKVQVTHRWALPPELGFVEDLLVLSMALRGTAQADAGRLPLGWDLHVNGTNTVGNTLQPFGLATGYSGRYEYGRELTALEDALAHSTAEKWKRKAFVAFCEEVFYHNRGSSVRRMTYAEVEKSEVPERFDVEPAFDRTEALALVERALESVGERGEMQKRFPAPPNAAARSPTQWATEQAREAAVYATSRMITAISEDKAIVEMEDRVGLAALQAQAKALRTLVSPPKYNAAEKARHEATLAVACRPRTWTELYAMIAANAPRFDATLVDMGCEPEELAALWAKPEPLA